MKYYGHIENEYSVNGFVMPIFKEKDNFYFQRIIDDNISYVELDLKNDIYGNIIEDSCFDELDYKKRIIVFIDDGEVYVGSKERISHLAKSFKAYNQYKSSFMHLEEEVRCERVALNKLNKRRFYRYHTRIITSNASVVSAFSFKAKTTDRESMPRIAIPATRRPKNTVLALFLDKRGSIRISSKVQGSRKPLSQNRRVAKLKVKEISKIKKK